MTPLEVLKIARGLIAKPDSWLKGMLRGWYDAALDTLSPVEAGADANCFCAEGAILEAAQGDHVLRIETEMAVVSTIGSVSWLWCFNDKPTTKHEDILNAFDATIARLEVKT